MSVTSGFFNSKNHDRLYDAVQISSMFDGLILDGVYQKYGDAFLVTPYSDADNTVIIGTGRGWFDHTWILNDTQFAMEIDAPNGMLSRIDAIVLDINREDSVRKNDILYVPGTFSEGTASKPELINEEMHKQYPIAYIDVPAGDSAPISSANIELTVGTDECPLVEAVLDVMDLDMFVNQMQGKFYEWFDKLQDVMDSNTALKLQHQIDDLEVYVDSQDQKYMNSTRNYENIPRKDAYRAVLLDSGTYSQDYTNIYPYIDSSGTTHILYAKKKSNTSMTYKYAKITKDGVLTSQDLSDQSKSSNAAAAWVQSQFCTDSEGNLYGALIAGSGVANSHSPLKIYKIGETVEEVFSDNTFLGQSYSQSFSNLPARPMIFLYNEYYDIFIIGTNGQDDQGLFYKYLTSGFVLVNQTKTGWISDTFYKYGIGNLSSLGSDPKKFDLNPDSWTSSSSEDFGEYVAPYVHSSTGVLIPTMSRIMNTSQQVSKYIGVSTLINIGYITNEEDYSDITMLGTFSHYIGASTAPEGISEMVRPAETYKRVEYSAPYCYNYTDNKVYATTALTFLYPDTASDRGIPGILLFNLDTFQSGIIIPTANWNFTDGGTATSPFYTDYSRGVCAMTDTGYYSSSFSAYGNGIHLVQANVEFTAPSIES